MTEIDRVIDMSIYVIVFDVDRSFSLVTVSSLINSIVQLLHFTDHATTMKIDTDASVCLC